MKNKNPLSEALSGFASRTSAKIALILIATGVGLRITGWCDAGKFGSLGDWL